MTIRILLSAAVLLAGCSNEEPITRSIESITTDAAAVQAAAPATVGKSDPGRASGLLGYVPDSAPTKLVVFCHGLGHTVEASWYAAVEDFVDADTAMLWMTADESGHALIAAAKPIPAQPTARGRRQAGGYRRRAMDASPPGRRRCSPALLHRRRVPAPGTYCPWDHDTRG